MLGLRFCVRAFSSCCERGPLFIAVRGPLTVTASLVAEHRLQTRKLSSCGSRAQLLRGMWDPPRPGLEPVSSALAGRFSTTAPPGRPPPPFLKFGLNLRQYLLTLYIISYIEILPFLSVLSDSISQLATFILLRLIITFHLITIIKSSIICSES